MDFHSCCTNPWREIQKKKKFVSRDQNEFSMKVYKESICSHDIILYFYH